MIAIIGNGNVASHLNKALGDKTEVVSVNSHTLANLPDNADVILICVTDSAIKQVVQKLPETKAIIAHTSGSVGLDIFEGKSCETGVFYPLQTFSKEKPLNYEEIPVFIEGSSSEAVRKLKNLASLFSKDVREADSKARRQIHLASVFACNFTNALAGIAEELLQETGVDFSVLIPLLKETVNKLEILSPKAAQTGPAVRKDMEILKKHLSMLETKPEIQKIYSEISELIISSH